MILKKDCQPIHLYVIINITLIPCYYFGQDGSNSAHQERKHWQFLAAMIYFPLYGLDFGTQTI